MKKILSNIALLTMFITLQASFAEGIDKAFLTEQDSELMQKNPDLEFVSLDEDTRLAILEAAQIDMEMQMSNSACIEASKFIEQEFRIIPYELANAAIAELAIKQSEQAADERGCKSKCYNNLRIKNLLTINELQVCGGGDISGDFIVYGDYTINPGSSPNCRSSRACATTPINTVNASSILNGPATFNCGLSLAPSSCLTDAAGVTSICLSDPAESVAMTVDKVLKWTLYPNGAIAHGNNNTASGTNSVATGSATQAIAPAAHAEGYYSVASGTSSHAEGGFTIASAYAAHAEGWYSIASGTASHAEGFNTTASGLYAHAENGCTTASGSYSHAEGSGTNANGYASHAEGQETIASGTASHAEGLLSIASGIASHAEGYSTTASAAQSHAEGLSTKASGTPSHAEGQLTTASGFSSHAEGLSTTASGTAAHAEGYNTTASGNFSRAAGQNATAAYNNAYCWADGNAFSASSTNQFVVKATGTTGGVTGTGIVFNNGAAKPLTTETSGTTTTWSYISGTPANWGATVPISIAQALDLLAAKIGPV